MHLLAYQPPNAVISLIPCDSNHGNDDLVAVLDNPSCRRQSPPLPGAPQRDETFEEAETQFLANRAEMLDEHAIDEFIRAAALLEVRPTQVDEPREEQLRAQA